MVINQKSLFVIFVLTFFVFTGCAKYSEVAEYSDSGKFVRFTVLDPTECDFARFIKIKVKAFGKEFGPFDLELLDCTKSFSRNDFKLIECREWVLLSENSDASSARVIVAVDLVDKLVVDEKTGFPDRLLEFLKTGEQK